MRMCHFCAQNGPFVLNTFFYTNHYYHLHLPVALFIVQNLKKIPTVDQDLQGCAIFGPRMVHLPPTILFLENY